jgi:hypothetical protein
MEHSLVTKPEAFGRRTLNIKDIVVALLEDLVRSDSPAFLSPAD